MGDESNQPADKACGCGWKLPGEVAVYMPKPNPDADTVVVALWCPQCDTEWEIEMGKGKEKEA